MATPGAPKKNNVSGIGGKQQSSDARQNVAFRSIRVTIPNMPPQIALLTKLATQARDIFETHSRSSRDRMFETFPHGACGHTSDLLGSYLRKQFGLDALYIEGYRPNCASYCPHAWLLVDGTILDITADQFGEASVIVAKSSPWHDEWCCEAPRLPFVSETGWDSYQEAWNALSSGMPVAAAQSRSPSHLEVPGPIVLTRWGRASAL